LPKVKKELQQLIESNIDTERFYIVDVHIGKLKDTSMIKVALDSDKGLTIDEISEVSRQLNKSIEDSKIVELYELEVTSPGVGEPLKSERQYLKNIGRMVKVLTNDSKSIEGKLIAVSDKIVIEEQVKVKHKVVSTKEVEIPLSEINKTVVLVSFN
jgi:ribosome maturation factor RimP